MFVAFDVSDDTDCGMIGTPPGAPAPAAADVDDIAAAFEEDEVMDETLFPVLAVVVWVVAIPSAP